MPDAQQPTPPQNVIAIPLPNVGGIVGMLQSNNLVAIIVTIALMYLSARFGVPIVPAPAAPAPAPVVPPTMVSQ